MNISIDKTKPVPIYMQIKEGILDFIKQNNLSAGSALPSVKKVALSTGVSIRTADQAFQTLIDDGICYRRPKKGTFIAEKELPVFSSRRIVGINCPFEAELLSEHYVENAVYSGIIRAGGKFKLTPFFITSHLNENVSFYRQSRENELAGVILLAREKEQNLNELRQYAPTAFVLINYDMDMKTELPENVYCIFNDDFLGGYQVAEYMITRGHRKFAILSLKIANSNYQHRIDGFLQAMRDYGIPFRPELLIQEERSIMHDDEDIGSGTALLEKSSAGWINYPLLRKQIGTGARLCELARQKGDFTALLCVSDWLAFGAKCFCPEIAVSGYDNIMPELSRAACFPTVSIDFMEMGRRAVKLLAEPQSKQRVIRVLPRLIPRKPSSGQE